MVCLRGGDCRGLRSVVGTFWKRQDEMLSLRWFANIYSSIFYSIPYFLSDTGQHNKIKTRLSPRWYLDICLIAFPLELGQVNTEAIEHREDNWSKRRLLLDVGATDAHDNVSRLPVSSLMFSRSTTPFCKLSQVIGYSYQPTQLTRFIAVFCFC